MKAGQITIYRAAAVRDAHRANFRPGAIAVKHGQVVAVGEPESLPRRITQDAVYIDRPGEVLLPAMVNAHAHLDLTDIGPIPYQGTFHDWLRGVTEARPKDSAAIERAVLNGVTQSRAAGVEYLGDVAYSIDAIRARRRGLMPGVSYIECFGIGPNQSQRVVELKAKLDELEFETPCPGHPRGVVLGISPHSPYTAGLQVYEQATRLSQNRAYRLCSHVAETMDELRFLMDTAGPCRDHLQRMGAWDASIQAPGRHPVDYLSRHLRRARWLLAHCNYVYDEHIDLLHRSGTSVVYCPVASSYFGHEKHRYRDMLEAGVNVCLGTDSILCQRPDDPQPMGVMGQMRFLYERDKTDPETLLAMATVNGMLALEMRELDATFEKGAAAVFSAVCIDPNDPTDPLEQVLTTREPVRPIRANTQA